MSGTWIRIGLTSVGSLVVWFTFMIGAIVTVKSLSERQAINLVGGIGIFAALIIVAVVIIGALWMIFVIGKT